MSQAHTPPETPGRTLPGFWGWPAAESPWSLPLWSRSVVPVSLRVRLLARTSVTGAALTECVPSSSPDYICKDPVSKEGPSRTHRGSGPQRIHNTCPGSGVSRVGEPGLQLRSSSLRFGAWAVCVLVTDAAPGCEELGACRTCLTQSPHPEPWAPWPSPLERSPAVLASLSTCLPLVVSLSRVLCPSLQVLSPNSPFKFFFFE